MSDLVKRLRKPQWQPTQNLLDDAADRIEELQARVEELGNRFTLERIEEAFREQWPHLEDEELEPYENGILEDLINNLKLPEDK